MRFVIATIAALFAASFSAAHAQDALTETDIDNLISAMPEAKAFGERLEAEGVDFAWADDAEAFAEGDEFTPYSDGVEQLKDDRPDAYRELGGLVRGHGFSDQEDWAEAGDRAMRAYVAVTMTRENPQAFAMMRQMSPEMMQMMPPEAQAQMRGMMAMMATIEETPEADRAAMEAKYADFNAAIAALGE